MQTAPLFHHDHSQAVRLPQEFRFPGTAVYVKQVGNALVLLPMDRPWDPLVASLARFSEDVMAEREQPPVPPRDDGGV